MNDWAIDTIIGIVNEQRQRLERARQYQLCGHPVTAIVSSDDGTSHCQDCERYAWLAARLDEWQAENEASMAASLESLALAQAEAANEPARPTKAGQS